MFVVVTPVMEVVTPALAPETNESAACPVIVRVVSMMTDVMASPSRDVAVLPVVERTPGITLPEAKVSAAMPVTLRTVETNLDASNESLARFVLLRTPSP
jgi:hypothetical protein